MADNDAGNAAATPERTADPIDDWTEIDPLAEDPRRDPDSQESSGRRSDWIVVESGGGEEEEICLEDDDGGGEKPWTADHSDQDCDQEQETDDDLYYGDELVFPRKDLRICISAGTLLSHVVMRRVLPHVPARSLVRMRCVCVDWNHWISSDIFIHTHACVSRSLSGVFYHDFAGDPAYRCFGPAFSLPDPALSFLPEPVSVKSSTRGLLCCRGRFSLSYYVCNPLTAEWTEVPPSDNDHGDDPAVVLVVEEPTVFNFSADYHLVCAYRIKDGDDDDDGAGIYGFEVFSSNSFRWRASAWVCAAERIVAVSGVAAGGAAHWRTTMQTVVSYQPAADVGHETEGPAGYRDELRWELGELGGRLCCTCLTGTTAVVQVLECGGGESWKEVKRLMVKPDYAAFEPEVEEPWPLRSQGESELLFLESLGWNCGWRVAARDVTSRSDRTLVEFTHCADFLPYISSLVHVKRDPSYLGEVPEASASSADSTQVMGV